MMNKKAVPFAIAKSAYDIPLSFLEENKIKVVLFDLDNTLASYKEKAPSKRTFQLIDSLKKAGIFVAIASNNTNNRVKEFAKDLGIPAYCNLKKPFSGPLKKLLQREHFNPAETALIGDQIMTDTFAGNGAGIRVILTHPLTKIDPIWTKINRFLAKGKAKKLYQEPYRSMWKEIL